MAHYEPAHYEPSVSSGSTVFANSAIVVFGALWVKNLDKHVFNNADPNQTASNSLIRVYIV